MSRKGILLLVLILLAGQWALSSCAPDPRAVAEAEATRLKAQQDAADQAQARAQRQAEWTYTMQTLNEIAAKVVTALGQVVKWGGLALAAGIAAAILATSYGYSQAAIGAGQAQARRAMLNANLIRLDPVTRQYPLFIQPVHGNRFALINANTRQVIMLDASDAGDRQMIASVSMVQQLGILAPSAAFASLSKDAEGVALLRPIMASAQEKAGLLTAGELAGKEG